MRTLGVHADARGVGGVREAPAENVERVRLDTERLQLGQQPAELEAGRVEAMEQHDGRHALRRRRRGASIGRRHQAGGQRGRQLDLLHLDGGERLEAGRLTQLRHLVRRHAGWNGRANGRSARCGQCSRARKLEGKRAEQSKEHDAPRLARSRSACACCWRPRPGSKKRPRRCSRYERSYRAEDDDDAYSGMADVMLAEAPEGPHLITTYLYVVMWSWAGPGYVRLLPYSSRLVPECDRGENECWRQISVGAFETLGCSPSPQWP